MGFAKQAGLAALAITDHDIVEGIPEATAIGNELGIEWCPASKSVLGSGESELHILGYFFWIGPTLCFGGAVKDVAATVVTCAIPGSQRLNELGIPITLRRSAGAGWHGSVGRPHIARLLMEKKFVTSAKEAFDRYLPTAVRPSSIRNYRNRPRRSGGSAKQAASRSLPIPPGFAPRPTACTLVRDLSRLSGWEASKSTTAPIHQSQTTEYLDLAKQCDLQVTGGSDFHGVTKPDIRSRHRTRPAEGLAQTARSAEEGRNRRLAHPAAQQPSSSSPACPTRPPAVAIPSFVDTPDLPLHWDTTTHHSNS